MRYSLDRKRLSVTDHICALARGNHYVNQLVSMKSIWGNHSAIGCVTGPGCSTTNCTTIAELHAIGWCSERFVRLDKFLRLIVPLYPRTEHKPMQSNTTPAGFTKDNPRILSREAYLFLTKRFSTVN